LDELAPPAATEPGREMAAQSSITDARRE